jgi:hypothetical protein
VDLKTIADGFSQMTRGPMRRWEKVTPQGGGNSPMNEDRPSGVDPFLNEGICLGEMFEQVFIFDIVERHKFVLVALKYFIVQIHTKN